MKTVRATMNEIAAKCSVSPHEFDELCFIDSPICYGKRVFYPFHCVSKGLAMDHFQSAC